MDKVVFKELMAAAGVPQVGYAAVRERAGAPSARPSRELAGSGCRCSSSRRGWAPRSGIVKASSGAEELDGGARRGVRPRRRVIVEASAAGLEVECAVLGDTTTRPRPSMPGEIVLLDGADWYDYEAKYTDGGMELVVPARISDPALERGARARRARVRRGRLRGPGARGLLRRTASGAGQRAQHDARLHPDERLPKLWAASGVAFPELCDRLVALALERSSA